ncbi:zincin [Morchella conica CCBAS932]|uniref:Zincin n=1 Tax=Morchella conica CCBAS932 TaxID=1392247 RepID=A0A3N4K8S2_9PEZI|nr:zincin [Morchella conica CCBAS932]
MSRLPFLWPSVSILLVLFITFSITNIFFSLPIPHAEHKPSPHEHTHAEDAHSHDHEDTHMDTPHIRLPPQPPLAFPPSAAAVHAAITASSGVLEQLSTLSPADATVENVLLPLAASEAALTALINTLTILSLASDDNTAEVLSLLTELNEHNLRASTHPSLSPLLTALHNSNNITDPETTRYLHTLYTGLLHTGAALTAEEQLRLEVLQEGLSNLTSTFQHNLITCNSSLSTSTLNLTGIPASSLPLPPSDTLLLTPHTIAAVLTAAEDPATRHAVWAAGENSVPENVPVFAEMIRARRETAGLLGYGSWAGIRLAGGRMAPDAGFVREFLAEARERIGPVGVREVQELEETLGGVYHLWDKRYVERLRERSEGAGMVFGLEDVLPRVLGELGGVFGVEFVGMGREEWEVMRGAMRREDGESVWDGVRDGEDAAGGDMAWHPDVKLFALTHTELIVLFHELGHAIHDLVSTTRFARHHGPAGVAVDFVEVPSRVGEEFAWDADVLVRLGAQESHARAVVAGRWEGAALAALRGVHIAAFDMVVHGDEPPVEEGEVGEVYNGLRREVIPVAGGEAGERLEGYATFGHLAMGYDAGYYGYLIKSVDKLTEVMISTSCIQRREHHRS